MEFLLLPRDSGFLDGLAPVVVQPMIESDLGLGRVTKRRLRFDWMLCDDSLLDSQRKTARVLAGRILKPQHGDKAPKIDETISLGDLRTLQSAARCSALLAGDPDLKSAATWIPEPNITYRKTASRWFK
jgi:hypothetical protein